MSRTTTLKGKPLNLAGPELKVGAKAPDAMLKKSLVDGLKISETSGKTRIFSVVPSLDTPVCAEQTRRFFKEATALPNVQIYTVSCDLPVAQSRFCGAEQIDTAKVTPLSDHKDVDFGQKYGVLLPDLRILSRAVFVVDKSDTLRYVEYVPEVANHPNYEAVLAAAKAAS
ncbi:MAG: thiol peroxidase [Phycisphaerae bacterium]|nr:thiol peroxidase [Phycisphaerae bacterium]